MSLFTIIILGTITAILIYGIMIYNDLVSIKHAVDKAWSNIDVLLKQQHEELPKLVEICKQYMKHERETLESVMQARSQVSQARTNNDITGIGAAEGMLSMGLGRLFAVAEAYPDLKADKNFLELQSRVTALENQIADRRELYNDSVNINNVRIEQFPDIFVARLLNFRDKSLLVIPEAEKAPVNMRALFQQ